MIILINYVICAISSNDVRVEHLRNKNLFPEYIQFMNIARLAYYIAYNTNIQWYATHKLHQSHIANFR